MMNLENNFLIEIFSNCLEQSENTFNDLILAFFGDDTENLIPLLLEDKIALLNQRIPFLKEPIILEVVELYKCLDMMWSCYEELSGEKDGIVESFKMLNYLSYMIGQVHADLCNQITANFKEEFSRKGNKARAKKFEDIKKLVQEDFKKSNYTSYAKFAENEFFKYKISYRTVLGYLYELS